MLELASILVLGIFAQWLAWRIKQPAILPLIVIGLLIGPISTLFTPDGSKLIDGDTIFTGDLLFSFVSISVGVILFEGGLTLEFKEVRNLASTVRNLLLFGMVITAVGGGIAAHYIMDMGWRMSFLFGALIIVSGPTVVMPILRNTRPNLKINTLLKWEGILIDPFGALVAVLVYEVIKTSAPGEAYTLETLQEFFITLSAGIVTGGLSGALLWYLLAKNRLPKYLRNVFSLGLVILTFAFAELIHKEAGLMAATVMGILVGNSKVDEIKKILTFKEDVSLVLISVLFILLSSRVDLLSIEKLGWESLILFAIVVFLIRPLYVFLATLGSELNWREKVFVAWIGPKGIVAAAVASLFSLQLTHSQTAYPVEQREAQILLPLTFLMIVGTVVLQATSAKWVAKLLKVGRTIPSGVLIVGASELSRRIAKKLKEEGFYVLLADTSVGHIVDAKKMGLDTYEGNVLSDSVFEDMDLAKVGKLMAITSNSGINSSTCRWFEGELGEENVFRLVSKEEVENENLPLPSNVLFHSRTDFVELTRAIRENGIQEVTINSNTEFEAFKKRNPKRFVPLYILKENGKLHIMSGFSYDYSKGDKLVFVKKEGFRDKPIEEQEKGENKSESEKD